MKWGDEEGGNVEKGKLEMWKVVDQSRWIHFG